VRAATSAVSAVDISVFVGGTFFGSFVLAYGEKRRFSEDERRLFRTLATRAGLAIQNALLYEETRRRTAELEALSRAEEALHKSLVLEDVYEALIGLAEDLFGAHRSLFAAFDEQGRPHCFASRGLATAELAQLQDVYHALPIEDFANRWSKLTIVEDYANDPSVDPAIQRIVPLKSSVDIPVFSSASSHSATMSTAASAKTTGFSFGPWPRAPAWRFRTRCSTKRPAAAPPSWKRFTVQMKRSTSPCCRKMSRSSARTTAPSSPGTRTRSSAS
jgi:GAF domain-containing protein